MLLVYTPDQPDTDNKIYNDLCHVARNNPPKTGRCTTADGVAAKTAWCREIEIGNCYEYFKDVPKGTLDIYGIRKHGTRTIYQPSGCPGALNKRSEYIDNLFSSLFQLAVDLISSTIGGRTIPENRVQSWLYRWGAVNFKHPHSIIGESLVPTIKCNLNVGDKIPELDIPALWDDNDMFGTITGIPIHWAQSTAIMSYLMYIPRLWGVFYSSPRVLPKLSQIGRFQTQSPLLTNMAHEVARYTAPSYTNHLWRCMAKSLMLPLWLTPCGKENFWAFTYLLIRNAIYKTYNWEDNLPDLNVQLRDAKHISGFRSWCGQYEKHIDAPIWFKSMKEMLKNSGPTAAVAYGKIVNYI